MHYNFEISFTHFICTSQSSDISLVYIISGRNSVGGLSVSSPTHMFHRLFRDSGIISGSYLWFNSDHEIFPYSSRSAAVSWVIPITSAPSCRKLFLVIINRYYITICPLLPAGIIGYVFLHTNTLLPLLHCVEVY